MNTEYTEKLIEKIKKEGIKMKPRFHFVLKMLLIILGILITILLAVYLVSLIDFISKGSGLGLLSPFGLRGFGLILIGLPWLLIGLSIVSILTLQILVKKFSFSYREPVLYSLIGIIAFVLLGGVAIGKLDLHQEFLNRAEDGGSPVISGIYRHFEPPVNRGFNLGIVIEQDEEGLMLETMKGDRLQINITDKTRLPFDSSFEVGQEVVVVGKAEGGVVEAFGIRGADVPHGPFGPKRRVK